MAVPLLFLLGLQGAQAICLFGFGCGPKIGPFVLKKTSFRNSDFRFLSDIMDPPSHLHKSWEFIGEVSGSMSVHFADEMPLSSYMSIAQTLTIGENEKKGLGIPQQAKYFIFSYPVHELKGASTLEGVDISKEPDISFFVVGGYMYFDSRKQLLASMALQEDQKTGWMKFERQISWKSEWSKHMPGELFHHTTLPALTNAGFKFFMWIPPGKMFLSDSQERKRGGLWQKLRTFFLSDPFPNQPQCPHGCFAYLGHHPKAKVGKKETLVDVYYPLDFDTARVKSDL